MSILNNIWNRIARKPDRRKAAATEFSETGNRVYAVATEEGVMLFSDTPKGMKARNSYLQHLADGFFNVAKVPETLRIYEMDLPTKRVAELADNCIEKLSKADLRSTDAQLRRSVVSFAPDKFADRSVLDGGVCREKFDLRPDFHNFDRLTREFGLGISPRNYDVAALLYISENGYAGIVAADKVHPFSYEYEFKELAEKLEDSMKARMNAPLSAHDFGYAALQKEARGDGGGLAAIGVPYHGWGVQAGRTDKPDRKYGKVTSDVASAFGRGEDRQLTGDMPQAGNAGTKAF
ncbi:DUF6047 family protein [Bacteroides ovatus]|nr:DUF6047 family protein [Bacteroides ovatus]